MCTRSYCTKLVINFNENGEIRWWARELGVIKEWPKEGSETLGARPVCVIVYTEQQRVGPLCG